MINIPANIPKIGQGFDIHPFVLGKKLILGGLEIPYEYGLSGHSDGDALCHAITDALLGASALGDIGKYFPDTDPQYKNADSAKLLAKINQIVFEKGWCIGNIDCSIITEKPKLANYINAIAESLAKILSINIEQINVKAKTNEKMDSIGEGKALAVLVNLLIYKK